MTHLMRLAETLSDPAAGLGRERLSEAAAMLAKEANGELRNLLGTIRVSSHVAQRGIAADDLASNAALDRIERAVTRCDRFLDDLLDMVQDLLLAPNVPPGAGCASEGEPGERTRSGG